MINKKVLKDMNTLVREQLLVTFTKSIESFKDVIMSTYDSNLLSIVVAKGSKISLSDIRESLIEELNIFSYINMNGSVTLSTPDMETFNFNKDANLRLLKTILEGISGTYVEMTGKDYESVFGKKPISEDTLDESFAAADTIYLIRYLPQIRSAENRLKKVFVQYPFSNIAPIRLFEEGDKFVAQNLNSWIETSIEEAQKKFINMYKGAKA